MFQLCSRRSFISKDKLLYYEANYLHNSSPCWCSVTRLIITSPCWCWSQDWSLHLPADAGHQTDHYRTSPCCWSQDWSLHHPADAGHKTDHYISPLMLVTRLIITEHLPAAGHNTDSYGTFLCVHGRVTDLHPHICVRRSKWPLTISRLKHTACTNETIPSIVTDIKY